MQACDKIELKVSTTGWKTKRKWKEHERKERTKERKKRERKERNEKNEKMKRKKRRKRQKNNRINQVKEKRKHTEKNCRTEDKAENTSKYTIKEQI